MSSAPASGSEAPSQITGGASVIAAARAAWRSAERSAGRARGSSPDAPTASTGSAAGTGVAARARRTVSVDTRARAATASNANPSERSSAISARLASVSFEGPFGPMGRPASPAVPLALYSARQMIRVSSHTPKAAATRRCLAALDSTSCTAASRRVAAAFGVCEDTLIIWRAEYRANGTAGLAGRPMGPKGPSKLTDAKRDEIAELRSEGLALLAVAARAGVSTDTVRRALAATPVPAADPVEAVGASGLEPLARPADRSAERQAARAAAITEAPPVICEGASLPLAGALLILPALAATGLLDAAASVYTTGRAAFYGLRSLVMAVVFAALVGEPRAEGLTRVDPTDAGRLLGLDRAPEVKTMRRRMEALAGLGRADKLIDALARHHLDTHPTAAGIFYVDGHVRAYHGGAEVPKAHVARIRLAMRAEVDTWVCDHNGDGVLVWATPPGASLTGELRAVVTKIRALVGTEARPTICFDRGGWSPKLFAELTLAGFDILTYRKGPAPAEPRSAFVAHTFTDDAGATHDYLLADRNVRIGYDAGKRRFACRQITRLDPTSSHHTQILTLIHI